MNKVIGLLDVGGHGIVVDVECHMSRGLPGMIIVGSANRAVDEARERLRSAFASCRLDLPRRRITINLAPADIHKDSTSFDLAMAVAILQANGQVQVQHLSITPVIGELGLDGGVRAVRGIIGKLLAGRQLGFKQFYIPAGNLDQARLVPGITLLPVSNLGQLNEELSGLTAPKAYQSGVKLLPQQMNYEVRLEDIVGQDRSKRALEIAAAGAHNLLLSGPPGTGKSLLAKALPCILPPMTPEEILEVTQLHSLASPSYSQLVTTRPFRSPHHSASKLAIVGGGARPRPGEVSLSHRGVLFLDELPEFQRHTLETLRQPLEDHVITVTRTRDNVVFPAQFILVATANPCPCGNFGSDKVCSCSALTVQRYQQKLSGPILDRIDLYAEAEPVNHANLLQKSANETSEEVRKRVEHAHQRQHQRYNDPLKTNATLTNREVKQYCQLDKQCTTLLNQAAERLQLSARGYMRCLKVARTIADLAASDQITTIHLAEALQYRRTS